MMVNIPTELLRTLVSVIDLRSFTKAAQALGVTQPAVSAQIKRLQMLLGSDILDKSAPGVSLTPTGEMIVNHARRLLSINDQILGLATPRPRSQTIRIGVPGDFVSPHLPWTLAEFRNRWPETMFTVRTGRSHELLDDFQQGQLDIMIRLSPTPSPDARHQWSEETVWIRGPRLPFGQHDRIPLVTFGEECVFHRIAVETLQKCGRSHETVYMSGSTTGLAAAISAGLGVMALARSRTGTPGLIIWEDGPLPKLPDIYCCIYARQDGDRVELEQLADFLAETLHPTTRLSVSDPKHATPAISV
jgi:DNA-binding transcriptional LysR family regulator